jgi:hypothetical protein
LTSWPEAVAVPNKLAETIASVLMERIIPVHTCPRIVISDRGTEYNNAIIGHLTKLMGVNHIKSSPYRPQTNGKIERWHRFMVDSLSKLLLTDPDQTSWTKYLPCLLMAYRTSINDTTGFTPFFLMFGRNPVLPVDMLLGHKMSYMGDDYVPTMLQRLHKAYVQAKDNMKDARETNRRLYNKLAMSQEFRPGDAVYYHDKTLIPGETQKFQPVWKPFFRVTEKCSNVNYQIKDQISGQTKVVHVEHLRAAHPENSWDVERTQPTSVAPEKDTDERVPIRRQPLRLAKLAVSKSILYDDEDDIPLSLLANRLRAGVHVDPLPPSHPERMLPRTTNRKRTLSFTEADLEEKRIRVADDEAKESPMEINDVEQLKNNWLYRMCKFVRLM